MAHPKPKPTTARELLRPSILRQTQLEAMGNDVNVTDLYLTLNTSGINIESAVLDATIERTIEGASTLTVTVYDRDFKLLRSGRLSARNDTEIDGLYFRLKSVRLNGHNLELTFEDREVAILRTYSKPIKQTPNTGRGNVTRAEFIVRMLREVKEVNIPYVIPELHKVQLIDGAKTNAPLQMHNQQNKGAGIPKQNNCMVKTAHMKEYQRQIANKVLDVGASAANKRPILVMGIMCAIQETTLNNPQPPFPPNPDVPVGVFQQFKKWGWPATGDIEKDGKAFYDKLISIYTSDPSRNYAYIIEDVQRSYPGAGVVLNNQVINSRNEWAMKTYGTRRDQAEQIVTAYGWVESTAEANQQWNAQSSLGGQSYEFYRGSTPTGKLNKQKYGGSWGPETTWHCIQRLADEVQWRAFFVSGTFYFLSEDNLLKSQPIATIDHSTKGVNNINGSYDENSKVADLTIDCEMGRWAAPPGSVVQIANMGPWNGRWIVNDVTRSLFSSLGTIVLKKLYPRLPEPSGTNIIKTSDQTWSGTQKPPNQSGKGVPDAPTGGRIALAEKLLTANKLGRWVDVNGQGLAQIQATAAGMQVRSPLGFMCYLDPNIMKIVLWLIQQGYKIGTYAWCSDHNSYDGPRGHQGGYAVDIEEINGHHIAEDSPQCRKLTLEVATLIHNVKGDMAPRQLICGGYGNKRDSAISALTLPAADSFYGSKVMAQHCNHIHYGAAIRTDHPGGGT